MKDLIIKRNKLKYDAMRLREVKFDDKLKKKNTLGLNKEQNELWKKYKFYDNLIKASRKEN